jgi:biopolymer transport protein ExbD
VAFSAGQGEEEVMSTINITPFTDVLLVLLIIFIILASVTKEPKLPDAKNTDKVTPSQIVVLINDKNEIEISSNTVTVQQAHESQLRHRPPGDGRGKVRQSHAIRSGQSHRGSQDLAHGR